MNTDLVEKALCIPSQCKVELRQLKKIMFTSSSSLLHLHLFHLYQSLFMKKHSKNSIWNISKNSIYLVSDMRQHQEISTKKTEITSLHQYWF